MNTFSNIWNDNEIEVLSTKERDEASQTLQLNSLDDHFASSVVLESVVTEQFTIIESRQVVDVDLSSLKYTLNGIIVNNKQLL